MDVRVGLWRRLSAEELMLLNCGVGEDSWESLGLQGDPTSPFWRRSVLGVLWKEWCWSWSSSTLATSCEELTHWKRLWCWEGLGAGGEGDDWGWDGWMAALTQWTRVWVNSGSWWWTGRPGVLRFMGSQRVGHDWATELNWTELNLLDHQTCWEFWMIVYFQLIIYWAIALGMSLVKASGPRGCGFRHHFWRESWELFWARRIGYMDRSKETWDFWQKRDWGCLEVRLETVIWRVIKEIF